MIDWGTAIVTGFAASLGSTVGSYIMTKHVIGRLEHKAGEMKPSLSRDLKKLVEYVTEGTGKPGDIF